MPQLTEVLKDVKYIQTLSQIKIPAAAMTVFEKRFTFTKVRNILLYGLTYNNANLFELTKKQYLSYYPLHNLILKIYLLSSLVFSSM